MTGYIYIQINWIFNDQKINLYHMFERVNINFYWINPWLFTVEPRSWISAKLIQWDGNQTELGLNSSNFIIFIKIWLLVWMFYRKAILKFVENVKGGGDSKCSDLLRLHEHDVSYFKSIQTIICSHTKTGGNMYLTITR